MLFDDALRRYMLYDDTLLLIDADAAADDDI